MRWLSRILPGGLRARLERIEQNQLLILERLLTMPNKDDLDNAISALEGDLAPITAELDDLKTQLAAALAAGTTVPQEAVDRVTALHAKFAALAAPAPAAPSTPST